MRRRDVTYHGPMEGDGTGENGAGGAVRELRGVPDTLFIPLAARVHVSRCFPDYFHDEAALSLARLIPAAVDASSSEYGHMASAARYHNLDEMTRAFAARRGRCAVVGLGAGLETAAFRLTDLEATFYEVDLPRVIAARRSLLPPTPHETLIGADVLGRDWMDRLEPGAPTLFTAAGLFQYFRADDVVALIGALRDRFPGGELIFDATNRAGLAYGNRYVRRTGNTAAPMRFHVDDPAAFARTCGTRLVEQRPFFTRARRLLGRRLGLRTRIAMAVADRLRRTMIVHLAFGPGAPEGR